MTVPDWQWCKCVIFAALLVQLHLFPQWQLSDILWVTLTNAKG
jgi:hypothetical protein